MLARKTPGNTRCIFYTTDFGRDVPVVELREETVMAEMLKNCAPWDFSHTRSPLTTKGALHRSGHTARLGTCFATIRCAPIAWGGRCKDDAPPAAPCAARPAPSRGASAAQRRPHHLPARRRPPPQSPISSVNFCW